MKKIFYYLFKFIFCIFLIFYSIKNLSFQNYIKNDTINIYKDIINKYNLHNYIQYLNKIIQLSCLMTFYGSILMIFDGKLGKLFTILGIIIEFILLCDFSIIESDLGNVKGLTYISLIATIIRI
jgi:hypothetical protein